jgi:hypothetical protein
MVLGTKDVVRRLCEQMRRRFFASIIIVVVDGCEALTVDGRPFFVQMIHRHPENDPVGVLKIAKKKKQILTVELCWNYVAIL